MKDKNNYSNGIIVSEGFRIKLVMQG